MSIDDLADHPELVPVLARWHVDEWGDLLPWWSFDDALAELRDHCEGQAVPTTWVALDAGRPVGSVSLLAEDLPEWAHMTPWLGNLFVAARARGDGLGRRLVAKCLRSAAALGFSEIYLLTAGQEDYYAAAGWRTIDRPRYNGRELAIMSHSL